MKTTPTISEKITSLLLVHKQANWDKNLGQYKSEHKCECGYTFISDGHLENSSVRVLMAEHITVQLLALMADFAEHITPEPKELHYIECDGYNAAVQDIKQNTERELR